MNLELNHESAVRRTHFKNLINMATADGIIDPNEKIMLQKLAKKWNLKNEEINQILKNPDAIKAAQSKNEIDKFEQLNDLITMMVIDGSIHPLELELCKSLGTKLGFENSMIDMLIDNFLKGAKHKKKP